MLRGLLLAFASNVMLAAGTPDAGVLAGLTVGFGAAFEECKDQNHLTKEMMEEFHHIWQENFEIKHREIGCTLICMSHKFELINTDTKLHIERLEEFIKTYKAGDELAKKIVGMMTACEGEFAGVIDVCMRAIEIAKCFRGQAQNEGFAPTIEMLESLL